MSFPKDLNLGSNKPIAIASVPSINRYRSDNSTYQGADVIRLEIPCGRQGQYLYPKDSYCEFRIKINQTNTAIANSATYIDGNIFSLFSRLRILHGSGVCEDILYTNKLFHAIADLQINEVERRGMCLTHLISDTTLTGGQLYNSGALGAKIYASDTALNASDSPYYYACFVLPSALLGSLAQKALPIGLMGASSLYLELELAPTAHAFVCSNATTACNSYTIDNFYYNAKISTLPADIDAALIQSTGGIINLPAISYKTEMKTIATGSSAFNDKFSFQFSSIKNFLFFVQNSVTANNTVNTAGGAGMLSRSCTTRPRANINEYFLTINGQQYPTQSIVGYARQYMELLRAFNSLTDTNGGGIISYFNYIQDAHGNASDYLAAQPNYGDTVQRRWLGSVDMDRFSGMTSDALMAGSSTIGQQLNLVVNFSTPTTDALVLYAAVMYDILYHIEGGLLTPKF